MTRMHVYIRIILTSLLAILFTTHTVLAATPVLTDEMKEDLEGPSAYVTMKLGDAETIEALAGAVVGISIVGDVVPLVVQPDDLNYTDMSPYNQWLRVASTQLYSDASEQMTLHYTQGQNRESAKYCAILTLQCEGFPKLVKYVVTEPGTTQWSTHLPWTNPAYEYAQRMAATMGGFVLEPNENGKLDFNRVEKFVKHISPSDCGFHDVGVKNPYVLNDVNDHAIFDQDASLLQTIGQTILTAAGEVALITCKMEVRLTKKMKLSNSHFLCLDGYNCTEDELTKEITDHSKTPNDGWTASLISEIIKKNPIPFGSSPNSVDLGGNMRKPIEFDNPEQTTHRASLNMEQAACTVTPQSLIDSTYIGNDEKTNRQINRNKMCDAPEKEASASGWNCKTNLGELASDVTNQGGKDWATNKIYDDSCPKEENAWDLCHSDVIDRAKKACVDPLFALTIWIHETAASNYQCGEQIGGSTVEDFGIHSDPNVADENFSEQLDAFLKLDYNCPHTINDWVSIYYIGNHCYNEEPDKTKVTDYVAELQEIYYALGGGTLPSWPKGSCSGAQL